MRWHAMLSVVLDLQTGGAWVRCLPPRQWVLFLCVLGLHLW